MRYDEMRSVKRKEAARGGMSAGRHHFDTRRDFRRHICAYGARRSPSLPADACGVSQAGAREVAASRFAPYERGRYVMRLIEEEMLSTS